MLVSNTVKNALGLASAVSSHTDISLTDAFEVSILPASDLATYGIAATTLNSETIGNVDNEVNTRPAIW